MPTRQIGSASAVSTIGGFFLLRSPGPWTAWPSGRGPSLTRKSVPKFPTRMESQPMKGGGLEWTVTMPWSNRKLRVTYASKMFGDGAPPSVGFSCESTVFVQTSLRSVGSSLPSVKPCRSVAPMRHFVACLGFLSLMSISWVYRKHSFIPSAVE